MLRWFCLFLALLLCPYLLHNKQVTQAKQYLHVKEKGNRNFNDKEFEAKLYKYGWRPGSSWCAYFVSLILDETEAKTPKIRSGLARNFITSQSIPAKRVLNGYRVGRNWLAIWQRGTTIYGHIGFVVTQNAKNNFVIIEGNTDDAVKIMNRQIEPMSYFRITHFTKVE